MLRIVLKNLITRRSRTILTMIGIVIGVAMIIALVSVAEGLQKEASESLGLLQGITVLEKDVMDQVFSNIPLSYIDEIERIQGVNIVSPEIYALIGTIDGESLGPLESFTSFIMGLEPVSHSLLRRSYFQYVTEGRAIENSDRYVCVIGSQLAEDRRKHVGDIIEVDGVDLRIVGIYSLQSRLFDSMIAVHIDIAREFSSLDSDRISAISVETENPEDAEKTALRIEMRLDDVDAQTQQEFSEQIGQFLGTMKTFQLLISLIAAIVGGIGVLNTMLTSVSERTKEIGIMKAVGWTDFDVMKGIVMESTLIGLAGGIIGIILGTVMSVVVSSILFFNTFVSPELALFALSFAMGLGLFGGLYPARKAAKLSPIDALRFE